MLHEKIDCYGKTAEEIKEIQEEKRLQFSQEKRSWLGTLGSFIYKSENETSGNKLSGKTSPKINPSKGEAEEDETFDHDKSAGEIVEIVSKELSEEEIQELKDQHILTPSPDKKGGDQSSPDSIK